MQGTEGPGSGDQVPVVEPARLHKAGLVARVAAQQERLIFYHRAGWTEGYCREKEIVGGVGKLRSQGHYQTAPLCPCCPSFVPPVAHSPELRTGSRKLCTPRTLLPVLSPTLANSASPPRATLRTASVLKSTGSEISVFSYL